MSYAEKRGKKLTGYWYGEVPATAAHPRFRRRFKDKDHADLYEQHIRVHGEEPAWSNGGEAPKGPTLEDVLKEAELAGGPNKGKWKRAKRPGIAARQRRFCVDFIGKHKAIKDVKRADFDRLVANLERRPGVAGEYLDNDTINRYLAAISGVMKWAVQHHYIDAKPSIPWQAPTGGRIHWLDYEQEDRLYGWLYLHGHPMEALTLRVLCATGLRWGEFDGLEVHEVLGGHSGSNSGDDETAEIALSRTKTDTPRLVPIVGELASELREMLKAASKPDYYTMRKYLYEGRDACGIDPAITIHCLRHTTATRLARQGENPKTIMDFMGHKTLSTTMKYVHMNTAVLAEAAKKMSPRRGNVLPFPKSEPTQPVENASGRDGMGRHSGLKIRWG